ncbi:MAG: hypothetical protein KAR40_07975 [Candidatus Sabulitectum sp.]|nr:hypothetical protein [Candidatus Sabulitectum sp.]
MAENKENCNLVDLQAGINGGSPVWILVPGAMVKTMPLDEVCVRLEKGFMLLPDEAERKVWDATSKEETTRAAAKVPSK